MHTGDSPSVDRGAAASIAFWAIFIIVAWFMLTHQSWYDGWDFKQKSDFWVAAGTLALAAATVASIFVTRSLVFHEERRHRERVSYEERWHRERLAPLIRIGLAPNKPAPGTAASPALSSGLLAVNIGMGPALHINVIANFADGSTPLDEPISGLPIGGDRDVSHKRAGIPYRRNVYTTIEVRYEDVFGNEYRTSYDDFDKLSFKYIRPRKL